MISKEDIALLQKRVDEIYYGTNEFSPSLENISEYWYDKIKKGIDLKEKQRSEINFNVENFKNYLKKLPPSEQIRVIKANKHLINESEFKKIIFEIEEIEEEPEELIEHFKMIEELAQGLNVNPLQLFEPNETDQALKKIYIEYKKNNNTLTHKPRNTIKY